MALRLIGTATTDVNGNAVLEDGYTGTGAGMVDIIAQTTIDGSTVQSTTYTVDDTIAYDLCTDNSHSSQWNHSDSNEVTIDSSGMLIDHNTTGLSTNTFKTPSASSNFCYTVPVMVEFDVVSVTSQVRVQFYDNTNLISLKLSEIGATAYSHVKLVMDNNSKICTAYVDDVPKLIRGTDTGTALSDYTFRFRLEDNSAFKFKNLKIWNTDSEQSVLFYDEATTGKKSNYWAYQSAWNVTPSENGTTITEDNSGNPLLVASTENATIWSNVRNITTPIAVELDVDNIENYPRFIIYYNSDANNEKPVFEQSGHYKFTIDSNGIYRSINGGTPTQITGTAISGTVKIGFTDTATSSQGSLRYKNFVVYLI